jgi:branched-chain amino acid aminotransferase
MKNVHYLDGKWVESADLKISAFDLSVLRGYGIFDFLRTYHHVPFRLKEHIDRFYNSAHILGLEVPMERSKLEAVIAEGIEKNKDVFPDFNIRIVATGGVGPDSTTPGTPSIIVIYSKAIEYPDDYYTQGVKIITHQYLRNLPDAKTLNYLVGIQMLQKAKEQKAVEVVYVFDGNMYEGTTSNFYVVKNGTIYTSKSDILVGVTRKVVFELAASLSLPVVETEVPFNELETWDEAFITASNKEVMPVVTIDDKQVGNGKVGPITQKLVKVYKEAVSML